MSVADGLNTVLVLITGIYALLTYRILQANKQSVDAMRDQAETLSRPYVTASITLEPDNPIFFLKIANTGRTSAQNVSLSIDKAFYKFGERKEDHNLAKLTLFTQPMDSFPPGSQIVISLAQGHVVFGHPEGNEMCPHTFRITARYTYGQKHVKECFDIDLRSYQHTDVPQDPLIRKMSDLNKTVAKIEKAVSSLSNRQ